MYVRYFINKIYEISSIVLEHISPYINIIYEFVENEISTLKITVPQLFVQFLVDLINIFLCYINDIENLFDIM